MSPGKALWRLSTLLLPRSFRRRHGGEMRRALEASEPRAGSAGRTLHWARAAADVVVWAARLRWKAIRDLEWVGRMMTMRGLRQDLTFAARALLRRPGFTLVAVLTLALGIGANTTIFSVVDGVLRRPLPYPAADRIGIVWHEFGDGAQDLPAVHALDARDYRERSRLLEEVTVATGRELILGGDEEPEVVDVGLVEAGFLEFFGAEPIHGRTIAPEEDVPGAAPVAVLSHRLWERRYGADPGIVGRTVDLAGLSMEVVGVAPASFRLLLPPEAFRLRDAEVWVSLRLDPAQQPPRNFTGYTAFGRLRPDVTFAQAQEEMDAMEARLKAEHPVHTASNLQARIVPLGADVVKNAEGTLLFLFGAVGFVLLIAAANVANLLLVRGQGRSGELALRAAMGASAGRLARLVLVEGALLAGAGVVGGLLLAVAGLEVLEAVAPANVPRLDAVALDGGVLAFAVGLGALTALALGLLPALRVAGEDPAAALKAESRASDTRSGRRARNLLMVGQVAGSLILLVGTGLMLRSFAALGQVDPGFDDEGVLTFRVDIPRSAFDEGPELLTLRDELMRELSGLPGVTSTAAVTQLPLTGSGALQPYAYDEETATNWESVTADQRWVTPEFFSAMGARLVQGRSFTGDPETDAGTIVIDGRLAERAFPGEDPVGERLQVQPNETPEEERYATVVGVVEHIRLHDLSAPHLTQIYAPLGPTTSFSVVVRAGADPAGLAEPARDVVAALIPGAPVSRMLPMSELTDQALAPVRFALGLMTLFGFVALLLAAVGIYGVLAYAVSRRTREIGVRMALGQSPGEIQRHFVRQGLGLVGIAVALGTVGAGVLAFATDHLFFGVEPLDPPTYILTTALLAGVSALACWVPARKATGIDPTAALRD